MLYTLSENGKMGLVPAEPERHEVVSQFTIPKGGDGPAGRIRSFAAAGSTSATATSSMPTTLRSSSSAGRKQKIRNPKHEIP